MKGFRIRGGRLWFSRLEDYVLAVLADAGLLVLTLRNFVSEVSCRQLTDATYVVLNG